MHTSEIKTQYKKQKNLQDFVLVKSERDGRCRDANRIIILYSIFYLRIHSNSNLQQLIARVSNMSNSYSNMSKSIKIYYIDYSMDLEPKIPLLGHEILGSYSH